MILYNVYILVHTYAYIKHLFIYIYFSISLFTDFSYNFFTKFIILILNTLVLNFNASMSVGLLLLRIFTLASMSYFQIFFTCFTFFFCCIMDIGFKQKQQRLDLKLVFTKGGLQVPLSGN